MKIKILLTALAAVLALGACGQGGGAVEKAIEMAQGVEQEEKITWIPYVPVTQENVEEFIGLN